MALGEQLTETRARTGSDAGQRVAGGLAALQPFVAMVTIYYVAAQVSLSLQADAIAVFWPAAGVAAGALVALGRTSYVPLCVAVAVATMAANIVARGNPALGLAFAACNTLECLTFAVLLRRLYGESFDLDSLTRVLVFLVAGLLAAGAAALPASLALKFIAGSEKSLLRLWRVWLESDVVGIYAIAPIVITMPALLRRPPPLASVLESTTLLTALFLATLFVFANQQIPGIGGAMPPGSVLFPLILWIAARSAPAFAAAASAVIALVVVWCTISGYGLTGDAGLPLDDRVRAAQLRIMIATLCSLSLSALFSERRRSEEALTAANADLRALGASLERRVDERTRDLAASNLRLEAEMADRRSAESKLVEFQTELSHVQRVAMAGELATFMAHELNQPLTNISATAAACVRLCRDGRLDAASLAGHLTGISAEAKRASGIVRQLRNLVRKERSRQRPLDLSRVVDDTLVLTRPVADRRGISITHQAPASGVHMTGDAVQLGQLVLNLLLNALDAVADGPSDRRQVRISTRQSGPGHAEVEVADTGPGIAPDVKARMLDPFFTTKAQGLGMGLTICKTIAEAHGAVLEFRGAGESGLGTIASVRFQLRRHEQGDDQ